MVLQDDCKGMSSRLPLCLGSCDDKSVMATITPDCVSIVTLAYTHACRTGETGKTIIHKTKTTLTANVNPLAPSSDMAIVNVSEMRTNGVPAARRLRITCAIT